MKAAGKGLVIMGRDLRVLSSNGRACTLSALGSISPGDHLFEHFPWLKGLIVPEALPEEAAFPSLKSGESSFDVEILSAGDSVCVLFTPCSASEAHKAVASELRMLEEQNRHLINVIEEAPVGIMFIDEAGKVAFMNKKQEENSRKKREKILNRHVWEVYPRAHEHPGVTDMYQKLQEGRTKRYSIVVDHYYPQFYRKDMIIRFSGYRVENLNWTALFIEIEDDLYLEKRKAEETGRKLRESETFLKQVLDASPNMVVSIDKHRRVVSFNKTAERLLGFSPAQVYNTPVDRFFPPEELAKLRKAASSPHPSFETMNIYRFDKTTIRIELYATKVKDAVSGKEIATLLLGMDIEERENLRNNLIQSQKMNFIGELVSALAHQLNNPLVGVINITDVLLKRISPEDKNYPLLKMIRDAGSNCHETISRLLTFSRKTGKSAWAMLDIQNVLNAAIELVSRHTLFNKITLTRSFHAAPTVRGDPVLLQQAFMNILFNSAQAVRGEGRIEVSCSRTYGMDRQVEISITDDGHGIPQEDISRIFEPFFTTKGVDKGTGIGLSLVYWIIQDHGGRIEVKSSVGKGTTFIVSLPAFLS